MIKKIKIAYLDSKNNICEGAIEKNFDGSRTISLCNKSGATIGTLIYYFNLNHAVIKYLYCYQGFRSEGIGSKLIDVLESCVANKSKAISGIFAPFQEQSDILVYGKDTNLVINTQKFYENKQYKIINYGEEKYPVDGVKFSDFLVNNMIVSDIVFKKTQGISPKFEFYGDILFDKEIFNLSSQNQENKVKA